jgi:hypothetical protein
MSREYTPEEVRQQFLEQVITYVDYWDKNDRAGTQRDRLKGLAFSILVLLDGNTAGVPKFKLVADPHPSDKEFLQKEGENFYREATEDEHDISGELHDRFYPLMRKRSN